MKAKKIRRRNRVASNDGLELTNDELQRAIDSLLKHAGIQKRNWFGSLGNDEADGAFSDCLGRMLYEQARRAGCKF